MQTSKGITREATSDDLRLLLAWAQQEGWNPGLHDLELFFAADNTGFFITVLDDTPIAGISLVKLNSEHAFLGLYLCKPEHRAKGYGIQTWRTAIESVGNRSIGLDGVVAQQSNYSKEQFVFSHRNIRFAGTLSMVKLSSCSNIPTIIDATDAHLNELTLYDATIGGLSRHTFFQAWLGNCDTRHTYLAIDDKKVVGAIGVRQCIEGYKLGPWLANDQSIAEALLSKVCLKIGKEPLMIDVPEPNQTAMDMMKRLSFSSTFETARMYRGQTPNINTDKLFGVATLELG